MTAVLYAVTGPNLPGDRRGVLVDGATGEVIYSHISSSKAWSYVDLTRSFGRDLELDYKYPDGWTVVELDSWQEAPRSAREANAERYPEKEGSTDG